MVGMIFLVLYLKKFLSAKPQSESFRIFVVSPFTFIFLLKQRIISCGLYDVKPCLLFLFLSFDLLVSFLCRFLYFLVFSGARFNVLRNFFFAQQGHTQFCQAKAKDVLCSLTTSIGGITKILVSCIDSFYARCKHY